MGIIPEMTPEERAAHDRLLDSAFGESSFHMSFQTGCNTCTGGKCPGCGTDFSAAISKEEQAARDQALNESFGEGPIAVALAGRRFDR